MTAAAVFCAEMDVVPGNHSWQYARRFELEFITSRPDEPSGSVTHMDEPISQWRQTCERSDGVRVVSQVWRRIPSPASQLSLRCSQQCWHTPSCRQ